MKHYHFLSIADRERQTTYKFSKTNLQNDCFDQLNKKNNLKPWNRKSHILVVFDNVGLKTS